MEELNKFYKNNRSLCFAFKSWIDRNVKPFSLVDGLQAVYDFCGGKHKMMIDVLTQIKDTMKQKVQGRSQVYADIDKSKIDIIPDENGKLTVVGYVPNRKAPLKGQHRIEDPTKTKGGTTNKTVLRSQETLENVGKRLRELYPGKSVDELKDIEVAIYNFAKRKKIAQMSIVDGLESGKYRVTADRQIKGKVNEGRIIFINEETARFISKELRMTEYKFYSNVKKFLHDLLVNPVNADVSDLLHYYGYTRNSLLKILMDNNVVQKQQKIVDKGHDGEPITPVMRVKYSVPKKNFENKLKRIYIREFESNVRQLNEDGEGGGAIGADSGNNPSGSTTTFTAGDYSFAQPTFSDIISQVSYNGNKNKKKEIDETTATTNIGNYQYIVSLGGDKESLARHNGKNGSVSVNEE